jgi:hypothetical protein
MSRMLSLTAALVLAAVLQFTTMTGPAQAVSNAGAAALAQDGQGLVLQAQYHRRHHHHF